MDDNINGVIELIDLLEILPNSKKLIFDGGRAIKSNFLFGNFAILNDIESISSSSKCPLQICKDFFNDSFEIYSGQKINGLDEREQQWGMSISLESLKESLDSLKNSKESRDVKGLRKLNNSEEDLKKLSQLYKNKICKDFINDVKILIDSGKVKFFIHEEDDKILGARFFHYQSNGRIQEYSNIVHPDHRRKGISSMILKKAVDETINHYDHLRNHYNRLSNHYDRLSNQTTQDGFNFSSKIGFKKDGKYYVYEINF